MRKALLLVAALALAFAFGAVGPVGASQSGACNGATVTLSGPDALWPPNHKMVTETITLSGTTAPGETLDTAVSSDEAPDALGSGHTLIDYSPAMDSGSVGAPGGEATTHHDLRAERSGLGSGRTYTITYAVDQGTRCMGSFKVTVPHDMGSGNDS